MDSSAKALINSLVGLPYVRGGQGPSAFDCWGITRLVQREAFGRELPVVIADPANLRAVVEAFRAEETRRSWRPRDKREKPADGDLVTMSRAGDEHHIGTWFGFDGGGVLHAVEGWGVLFDALPVLATEGFRRIAFYAWEGG